MSDQEESKSKEQVLCNKLFLEFVHEMMEDIET
jgi:hypothetical protein